MVLACSSPLFYFTMQLNQWPLVRAGYDTNDSYASFVATVIVKALVESFSLALLVVIAVAPERTALSGGLTAPTTFASGSAFTLAGLTHPPVFCAGVVGLCLAAVHIGYVVAFYVCGAPLWRLGATRPAVFGYAQHRPSLDFRAYDRASYAAAAVALNFCYRMFSIRFLMRVTNWRILAIVLPAFAAGVSCHSNYPQEPPYIRGIVSEQSRLSLPDLVMLRWGSPGDIDLALHRGCVS